MKPELHVALQVDVFEDAVKGRGETGYTVLRRVFRERLADFAKRHPEVTYTFNLVANFNLLVLYGCIL